jgi:hypothetical protein
MGEGEDGGGGARKECTETFDLVKFTSTDGNRNIGTTLGTLQRQSKFAMEPKGKRELWPKITDAFNDGKSNSPGGSRGIRTTKGKLVSAGKPRSIVEASRSRLGTGIHDRSKMGGGGSRR